MSAVVGARPTSPQASSGRPSGPFTGTGKLLRFMFRRDRIRLPAWVIGIGIFVPYFFTAFETLFPSEAELAELSAFTSGPMVGLLGGPGYGLGEGLSYVTFFTALYVIYFMLAAALMNILLVSRHTRVEEQTGRAELIRANVVGRYAALTATLIMAAIGNAAVTLAVLGGLLAFDAPASGSLLVAVGVGAFGMVFAGVAFVCAQVSEYSRVGSAIAGAVLGGTYVLRATGDMSSEHGNVLSWLTPYAWSQQTRAFVDERWWPLGISAVVSIALIVLAYRLSDRRDLGAGLRASRRGRASAAPWVTNPIALALRLHRGGIRGWVLGLVVAGLVYGSTTGPFVDSFADMTGTMGEMFTTGPDPVLGYLNTLMVMMVIAVAVYALLAVMRVRAEELDGRAEPVLATAVSKQAWLAGHILVTAVASIVLLVLACAAMGLTAASSTGDWSLVGELTVAGLVGAPAVLVIVGLACALYGFSPRLLPIATAVVTFSGLAAFFGELLELPEALLAISPWHYTPAVPGEAITAAPLLVQTLVALVLAAVGLLAFRRRDLVTT
ncbi:ABC transporter permease [Ruania alkalisoli]|uniref:ABC transporter permease n=1 Tax=Ruania alkalisoli TaxID=2779775 RepID=A0A7M1SVQ1_9MICO|nr:ABC transporter permease [Ruania alkalisoli]QOR71666.1 ABC transporter permease [Ruania alkalisoli]